MNDCGIGGRRAVANVHPDHDAHAKNDIMTTETSPNAQGLRCHETMTVEELGAPPAASLHGKMNFTRSLDMLVLHDAEMQKT